MAFTITDILTEFGQYYIKSGQNLSRLKRELTQPSITLEQFGTRLFIDDTKYRMSNPIFTSLLQPFRKDFEAKGNVDFHPNTIDLNHLKVDLSIYPHDIEPSWLGFLAGQDSAMLKNWPIVRYILEEYVAKQIQEDKELSAVYKGEYDEDGDSPTDSMDGLKVKIMAASADEKYPLNIIEGVEKFDKDTIYDQIEFYDEQISDLYTNVPIIHFMAPYWVRQLKKNKRAKGYYLIEGPEEIDASVDFTKHVAVGLPSMSGTTDMFSTVRKNLIHLVKRPSNKDAISVDMQVADRQVKILSDWWEGVGFGCNKLIWTTAETVATGSGSGSASGSSSASASASASSSGSDSASAS